MKTAAKKVKERMGVDFCAICGMPKKGHKVKGHQYTEDFSDFLAHRLKAVENQVVTLGANMFPADPHSDSWRKPWPKKRRNP